MWYRGPKLLSRHAAAFTAGLGAYGASNKLLSCEAPRLGKEKIVLAADVGGTNSRFTLYKVDPIDPIVEQKQAPGKVVFEKEYKNFGFKSFLDVVTLFLEDAQNYTTFHLKEQEGLVPCVACLAVAGVVTQNQSRLTNVDWVVDGNQVGQKLGIGHVEVINDFVAQGYGILTLADDEVTCIHEAPQAPPGAPIACLGAGTGLGECYLCPGPTGQYVCYPSEGGHAEWAPRGMGSDQTQIELLKYLKVKFSAWNRISVERIVSGKGICNVYEFLAYRSPEKVDMTVHREFLKNAQDASIIAKNAHPGSLCEQAMLIYAGCYGAEAGVLALQYMPFRGLYLTGGVTRKTLKYLMMDNTFMDAYLDKGRVSPSVAMVPLYVINNEDMGKRGAHLRAVQLLKEANIGVARRQSSFIHLDKEDLVPPRERSHLLWKDKFYHEDL